MNENALALTFVGSAVYSLSQSVEVPLGPVWEVINVGGGIGVMAIGFFALFKGWLRIGKSVDERLAAETKRAEDAERREKWWQELAVRQGRLLPTAVQGFEEATVMALEQQK